MSKSGTSLSFKYNESGLRTKKTVGSTVHTYTYNNGKLAADVYGNEALYFHYDSLGDIIGFTYKNGVSETEYFYVKNVQGDVLNVINAAGAVQASYTYDAWGNVLASTGTLANTNPIRYRGYYYDNETGLYYLQSRYYDPEVRRFINADAFTSTGQGILGTNMFAYCGNNPANTIDSMGSYPVFIEKLFDYAAMHTMTQISCAIEEGWAIEQYISGPRGTGRLDLYDSVNNQYYEIKSKGAYDNSKAALSRQMEKYDNGTVKSSKLTPTRGTKEVSGSFKYMAYDVTYYTPEPGVIVYNYNVNHTRVSMFAALGIGIALTIIAPEIGVPLTSTVFSLAFA